MEAAIRRRRIGSVFHFTRLENLPGILNRGIVPRQVLEGEGADAVFNDEYRHDGFRGASCFSIAHPNYKMFWPLRKNNPGSNWVVIAVNAQILWQMNCAFCVENAAKGSVTAVPLIRRRGVAAFEAMFGQLDGLSTREEMHLTDDTPTCPQAEVLVFGVVPPEQIVAIFCQTRELTDQLSVEFPRFQFLHDEGFFAPRHDYEHWR